MTRRASPPPSRRRRHDKHGSFVYVLTFGDSWWRRRPWSQIPLIIDPAKAAAAQASEPAPSVQPLLREDA